MPSNCSHCSHNIQENDRLTARIAALQAQRHTKSLGKGHLNAGKDETASVPPISTDSSINPLAQSPQPDNFLMASGRKYCRNAQPVSLIQSTNFQLVLPIKQRVGVRGRAFSGQSSSRYRVWDAETTTISSDKWKNLVIGDSITCSIRLKTNHPAIIHCLPGGRATDVLRLIWGWCWLRLKLASV
jgi:hypothetical protein